MQTMLLDNKILQCILVMSLTLTNHLASNRAVAHNRRLEECVLRSTVDPQAKMRWHLPQEPGAPIGLWRGVLVQGGQIKAELTASRFQGYGSSIWNHANSKARSEYLLPFAGSKPAYSVAGRTNVDGFLFTGLGSDFYYGAERSNHLLIQASEGIWRVEQGCSGFLMFNR
jgi:hypothetical protein